MYLTSSLLVDTWVFSNFASINKATMSNHLHSFVYGRNFTEILLPDQKDYAFTNWITTAKLPTIGLLPIYPPISTV